MAVMAILNNRFGSSVKLNSDIHERETFLQQHDIDKLKTDRRRVELLKKLKIKDAVITENEIQTIKNSYNGAGDQSRAFAKLADSELWDRYHSDLGTRLTEEQTVKGLAFLKKGHPEFANREKSIIDNFREFRLAGFKDDATYRQTQLGIANWTPVYMVFGNDGSSFQYYYNGKMNITG